MTTQLKSANVLCWWMLWRPMQLSVLSSHKPLLIEWSRNRKITQRKRQVTCLTSNVSKHSSTMARKRRQIKQLLICSLKPLLWWRISYLSVRGHPLGIQRKYSLSCRPSIKHCKFKWWNRSKLKLNSLWFSGFLIASFVSFPSASYSDQIAKRRHVFKVNRPVRYAFFYILCYSSVWPSNSSIFFVTNGAQVETVGDSCKQMLKHSLVVVVGFVYWYSNCCCFRFKFDCVDVAVCGKFNVHSVSESFGASFSSFCLHCLRLQSVMNRLAWKATRPLSSYGIFQSWMLYQGQCSYKRTRSKAWTRYWGSKDAVWAAFWSMYCRCSSWRKGSFPAFRRHYQYGISHGKVSRWLGFFRK